MGTRKQRQRQEQLWITHTELATAPGHPFYKRLNQLLDGEKLRIPGHVNNRSGAM
jgi:hypothetical protein